MKTLLAAFLLALISCSQPTKEKDLSSDQQSLQQKIDRCDSIYYAAPNQMSKDIAKKECLTMLHSYLRDTLHYEMKNCKVKINKIDVVPFGEITAFVAEFEDENHNEYYTELDFDNEKKDSLYSNPVYKLLKDIPEGSERNFSFLYLGEVEWKSDFGGKEVKLHVLPFPANYNFDSSRQANKKVK